MENLESAQDRRQLRTAVSRRHFIARGGAVGAGLLLPGALSACGSSSSGSSGSLKIGYVTPATGSLAPFGQADTFVLNQVRQTFKDGIKTKNGKRNVEIVVRDSQSSSTRAGQVASDLILNQGVSLMLVSSTPETTNPVSDQCELNGVPCLSTVAPWQSWFFGRKGNPKKPFKWTYHFFWGVEDLAAIYLSMWPEVKTNKSVGGLWPNDSDGNALSSKTLGVAGPIIKAGFKLTDPGRYPDGTADFSAQISQFKGADAQILTGVPIPPDFTTFWKQAAQQGYRPTVATVAKAMLFPSTVDALGNLGENLSTECWWSPHHPFSSSLTHQTSAQLAAAYEKAAGQQWTQPIGFAHALFELASDVFSRATDPGSKTAIADAIRSTNLSTVVGQVSWQHGPVPNVAKTPLTGGQWVKATGKYQYDLVIVSNAAGKMIPKTAKLLPIA